MTLGRPSDFSARATREGTSVVVAGSASFGSALLLGSVVGALAAVPGAIRAAGAGAPALFAWLALAGAASVPAGLVLAALHGLRPIPDGLRNVGWTVPLAFGPVVFFARTLWAGTHHRPLGATTFSFAVALVLAAVLVGVARLRRFGADASGVAVRRTVRLLLIAAASGSIALGLLGAAPTISGDMASRARGLDAVVLLVLGAVAANARIPVAGNRVLCRIGPIVYSILGVAAVAVLRAPELGEQVRAAAPVLLAPWTWVFSG